MQPSTINHQPPDKIPFEISFTQKAHQKMVEFYDDPDFDKKLGNCLSWLSTEPKGSWKEISPNIWQDQFGTQWDCTLEKDIGNVCNQLVTPESLNEYIFPDPSDPSRYADYGQTLKQSEDAFTLVNLGFSLYERDWTLVGMENLMVAMIADKNFVHTLLDRIVEFNLSVIENACNHEIDAMMFGYDWSMQTGLQMGWNLWREFIHPRIKQMYALVKSKGKFVFIHSCGKVDEVFLDLIDIRLDMFNPFQPEVIDVFDVKQRFGYRRWRG
ncbi:uroporphyrinogen decarboxylase family protein [Chloroflexota bacterium]